jgi:type II secretory pathway predicted ATPase ExeA
MNANHARLETKLRSVFGFKSLPFTKELQSHQVMRTEGFTEALDKLRYLVDRRGIGVIFGAPGTGKSTLLRMFLDSLGKATHTVCYVNDTTCTPLDLYRVIARAFQLAPPARKSDIIKDIKDRIVKLSRVQKTRAVLVIDEAQLLTAPFLDELRILTSFDKDASDDLTLILAGHPQLESSLRLAVNEALAQRIIIRIRLRSFHPQEVEGYITARLKIAGRTAKLFLPDAVEAIAKAARGVPRLIDRIAEQSLLIALKNKRKDIDAEIVTEAVDEVDP